MLAQRMQLGQSVLVENMRAQGLNAAPGSPEQFAALLKSDGERYTKIARAANIRLD
jgi:hypothetical protein